MTAISVDREHDAILVVDLQPDFMPGGALPIAGGDEVVAPIAALLRQDLVRTVVATQDWHPAGHISFASSHAGHEPFASVELPGGHEQASRQGQHADRDHGKGHDPNTGDIEPAAEPATVRKPGQGYPLAHQ